MGDEKELVVIEQKQVDFYEDELTAVRASDGQGAHKKLGGGKVARH